MSNTAQRIQLILAGWDGKAPITGTINTGPISQGIAAVAAEIDALTAQLAEARAEVERLRPAAEAWEAREALIAASKIRDAALWEHGAPNGERYTATKVGWLVAEEAAETAAARAREARK